MKRLASLSAAVAAATLVFAVTAESAGPTNLTRSAYIAINYDGSVDVDRTNGVTLTPNLHPDWGGGWQCAQMSFVPITDAGGPQANVAVLLRGDNTPQTTATGAPSTNDAMFFSGPDALCPDAEAAIYGGSGAKEYVRFLG